MRRSVIQPKLLESSKGYVAPIKIEGHEKMKLDMKALILTLHTGKIFNKKVARLPMPLTMQYCDNLGDSLLPDKIQKYNPSVLPEWLKSQYSSKEKEIRHSLLEINHLRKGAAVGMKIGYLDDEGDELGAFMVGNHLKFSVYHYLVYRYDVLENSKFFMVEVESTSKKVDSFDFWIHESLVNNLLSQELLEDIPKTEPEENAGDFDFQVLPSETRPIEDPVERRRVEVEVLSNYLWKISLMVGKGNAGGCAERIKEHFFGATKVSQLKDLNSKKAKSFLRFIEYRAIFEGLAGNSQLAVICAYFSHFYTWCEKKEDDLDDILFEYRFRKLQELDVFNLK